ncbi:MAG TPA: hypothetical protein VFZ21_24160 [Gemmatimonadaceae bacterium]|nr:hypothetical protein [Gemmatimonadaceae bacterium]
MTNAAPESSFAREFPELAQALAGQFRVERDLGRGGMGVVYLARELKLDRLVALKVLPAVLARDPATLERFLREARTAAHLAPPERGAGVSRRRGRRHRVLCDGVRRRRIARRPRA